MKQPTLFAHKTPTRTVPGTFITPENLAVLKHAEYEQGEFKMKLEFVRTVVAAMKTPKDKQTTQSLLDEVIDARRITQKQMDLLTFLYLKVRR